METKSQNFFVIFDRKMAAILNFDKFFNFFFQKASWDPRGVIVWKFEGPTSNGLVATALFSHKQTRNKHTKLVKLVDRQARRTAMDRSNIDNSWNREKLV